ncbi:MAG: TRAP transporter small permease subunit [Pseudomonadota bacterium]
MARINDIADTAVSWLMATAFAALIAVVALQVLARNVFSMPVIWTLDVAQLLFAWCIFLGAGVAFRRGAHYIVDLWPAHGPLSYIPVVVSFVASVTVVWVLIWNGIDMAEIMSRRTSQTLDISLVWYFTPIPICGVLIGMALLEQVQTLLAQGRET